MTDTRRTRRGPLLRLARTIRAAEDQRERASRAARERYDQEPGDRADAAYDYLHVTLKEDLVWDEAKETAGRDYIELLLGDGP